MKKNFVEFFSPGTFVAETTTLPIEKWDVDLAVEMSKGIKERHGATPYGFRFITKERSDEDLDSKVSKTSNMYYLGGEIFTADQLEKLGNPDDRILISNMRDNDWERVIVNKNSWKWTQPLEEGDVVLDVKL